jgi:hypothetical protein
LDEENMTLRGQPLGEQVVQSRWMSAQDTAVPLSNTEFMQFASGTGTSFFHHDLLAAPALLRRIAAVLPINEEADRALNAELSRTYANFPTRKIHR